MKAFVIYIGVMLYCVCSLPCVAQNVSSLLPKKAKNISSFIPKGWIKIDQVRGDFNDDGKPDIALLVIDSVQEKVIGDANRSLIILQCAANGFVLSSACDSMVLCYNCGGIHGDPYVSMKFKGNILSVSHLGGSGWRWAYNHKFQFREGKWVLIGQTFKHWMLTISGDKYKNGDRDTFFNDTNFLTGEYIEKDVDPFGKKLKDEKGKKPLKPLVELKDFSI